MAVVVIIMMATMLSGFLASGKIVKAVDELPYAPVDESAIYDGSLIDSLKNPSPVSDADIAADTLKESPKGPFDDIGAAISRMWNAIKTNLKEKAAMTAKVAYKNALRYFLNKVAYDTATYIATGSPGQKPLFITESWNEYFQKVGDEAVGTFMYDLGKSMWGKNVCVPWEPLAQIDLTVAVKRASEPEKPICTWPEIRKNIERLSELGLNDLVQFRTHFNPSSNQLGSYLTLRSGALEYKVEKENQENLVRIIEGQFKSVVNPITKQVKTPSNLVEESLKVAYQKTFTPMETYTGSPVADAIGTFTNTLVSKYLEKIFKKGFNPNNGQAVISDIWTVGGIAAARLFFADLAAVDYKFNVGFDVNEFTIDGPGQFNKVVDEQFIRAVEQKCTLGQAAGLYKPGSDSYRGECWADPEKSVPLISNTADFGFTQQKDTPPDAQNSIPYRSILVLRKFRVVPVGWELAASYYNQYGNRYGEKNERLTLKILMEEYRDPTSPYYQLVDPDWVLKMPQTQCAREGAGPDVLEDTIIFVLCASNPTITEEGACPEKYRVYSFQRMDYCADYENCLDDTSGTCNKDNFGYCIEEQPMWNISGNSCENTKYEATCETLTETATKKNVSYLLNTLSGQEVCNDNNAGCRAYCDKSVAPFGVNDWQCANSEQVILDNQSATCTANKEGCTLVYASKNKDEKEITAAMNPKDPDPSAYGLLSKKFVKLAPEYYSCEGYNTPVSGMETPEACATAKHYWRDDLKLCVESGAKECANFVKFCQAEDAACELYTPISMGSQPAVPGVIVKRVCTDGSNSCADSAVTEWNDECPDDCVGYKSYHQSEAQFDKSNLDANFIAKTGTTCSEPGCDEFTNLDEVAKGGEGKEYYKYLRQCVKPDTADSAQKTYYTWEGSDTSGYQLKKWLLMAVNNDKDVRIYGTELGSPKGTSCLDVNNKDCREYFDANLKPYKRLYSSTIIVTEDCHPYRRSNSIENDCKATNGQWLNMQCIYMAVPNENVRCSASNNLCREYKSNQSYNYQKLLESTFAMGSLDGWSGGVISKESVRRGDNSLKITTAAEHELVLGDLEIGKNYTVEFLAKGSGSATVGFIGSKEETDGSQVTLTNDWNFYAVKIPKGNNSLIARDINNNKLVIYGNGYFDNIVLKKMDSIMLIKNSWVTPDICAATSLTGSDTAATMLGCETYKPKSGQKINLRAWKSLCFEEVVGCEAVINTYNYEKDIREHEKQYLVLDKKFECAEGSNGKKNMGCTKLGLITPDAQDQTKYNFTNVFKIVLPENEASFCKAEEVFCDSYYYADEKGNKIDLYFKNPAGRVCAYNITERMWVITGTTEPCPTVEDEDIKMVGQYYDRHCLGGTRIIIDDETIGNKVGARTEGECVSNEECTDLANPGLDNYGICTFWSGACNPNSSGCREYQDPQEPVKCDKDLVKYADILLGRNANNKDKLNVCNYYYYKNPDTCDSAVNPSAGCVGFNQTDNPVKDKRSYKVCQDKIDKPCQNDGDCDLGRCVYSNEL